MSTSKKYCPAVPGMLFLVCGMSNAEISAISSIPMSAVQNILVRKFGRTRREKRETAKLIRTSNCSTKYCRALVGMLIGVIGMSTREVADYCDMPIQSVNNILRRNFKELKADICRTYLKDIDIDALEAEYLAGASTYELGEKYGVCHSTISKWMIQRGHKRGKLCACEKTHICEICGNTFVSRVHNAKYCSKKCENKAAWRNYPSGYIRRARKYGAVIDNSVTLKKVYERDGGICQLCGGKCDYSDINDGVVGKTYPSIDHIVSLKNGGSHTWDNVQLAHHFCNSVKREHELDEIHDKVIFYAKEQAIAHKCA